MPSFPLPGLRYSTIHCLLQKFVHCCKDCLLTAYFQHIWRCSLGVVLWELITLKRPWDNSETEEPGSLEDTWVPELDSGNDQPIVQQQRITGYAIIQARGLHTLHVCEITAHPCMAVGDLIANDLLRQLCSPLVIAFESSVGWSEHALHKHVFVDCRYLTSGEFSMQEVTNGNRLDFPPANTVRPYMPQVNQVSFLQNMLCSYTRHS